jgi:hypothetical protein
VADNPLSLRARFKFILLAHNLMDEVLPIQFALLLSSRRNRFALSGELLFFCYVHGRRTCNNDKRLKVRTVQQCL